MVDFGGGATIARTKLASAVFETLPSELLQHMLFKLLVFRWKIGIDTRF